MPRTGTSLSICNYVIAYVVEERLWKQSVLNGGTSVSDLVAIKIWARVVSNWRSLVKNDWGW